VVEAQFEKLVARVHVRTGGREYEPISTRLRSRRTIEAAPRRSLQSEVEEEMHMPHPRHGTQRLRHAKELVSREGEPRGSATRGWSTVFPRQGRERRTLYKACGQKCFLGKPTYGSKGGFKIGFPICRRCVGSQCECRPDARGVSAAKHRASQYGHVGEYVSATRLQKRIRTQP
jgi:hypothetical protein